MLRHEALDVRPLLFRSRTHRREWAVNVCRRSAASAAGEEDAGRAPHIGSLLIALPGGRYLQREIGELVESDAPQAANAACADGLRWLDRRATVLT